MNRTVESYPVSIFIAGDPNEAADCCRAYCDEVGFCVTVSQALYVFRGGEEEGVVVGLINYARFPKEPEAIFAHAYELGKRLCEWLKQESYTIQASDRTLWVSHRAADNPAQAIEAATAGETTEIGSTEGESAVPKECAQKGPA